MSGSMLFALECVVVVVGLVLALPITLSEPTTYSMDATVASSAFVGAQLSGSVSDSPSQWQMDNGVTGGLLFAFTPDGLNSSTGHVHVLPSSTLLFPGGSNVALLGSMRVAARPFDEPDALLALPFSDAAWQVPNGLSGRAMIPSSFQSSLLGDTSSFQMSGSAVADSLTLAFNSPSFGTHLGLYVTPASCASTSCDVFLSPLPSLTVNYYHVCPVVSGVANARVRDSEHTSQPYAPVGENLVVECELGAKLEPPHSGNAIAVTCSPDGSYSPTIGSVACAFPPPPPPPYACELLPPPTNGNISFSNYGYRGSMATSVCNAGYDLVSGSTTRECTGESGSPPGNGGSAGSEPPGWSGIPVSCIVVECPGLLWPTNGVISCSGASSPSVEGAYQEQCNTTCNAGFSLVGAATRTCRADSTWSGSIAPFCSSFNISTSYAVFQGPTELQVPAGATLGFSVSVRDSSGFPVMTGADAPMVRTSPDGVNLVSETVYRGNGLYNALFPVATKVGNYLYELGVNNLPFETAPNVLNVTVVPGPLDPGTTYVEYNGEELVDSQLDIATSVALEYHIVLRDEYENALVRLPAGGTSVFSVILKLGSVVTPVLYLNEVTEPSARLALGIYVEVGGTYTMSIKAGVTDIALSPLIVNAAQVCQPGFKVFSEFACTGCGISTYSDTIGAPECTACPQYATSPELSSTYLNCSCLPDYWFGPEPRTAASICIPCPVGGVCDGGDSWPYSGTGYFEKEPGSAVFVECERAGACAGSNGCSPGHLGYMCNECAPGYHTGPSGNCRKCPKSSWALILLLMVLIVGLAGAVVAVLALTLSKQQEHPEGDALLKMGLRVRLIPATLSMTIVAMQVVGMLSESRLGWPTTARSAMRLASVFNIDMRVFGTECTIGSFHNNYVFSVSLPLMLVAALAVGFFLLKLTRHMLLCKVLRVRSMRAAPFLDGSLFTIMPVLYIPIARTTLVYFDCTQLPNGNFVLDADLGVKCFDHSWWALFPVAVTAVTLYVVGLPLYALVRLVTNRADLFEPHVFSRFGALYKLYRTPFYLGEIANMSKRLLLVVASLFLSRAQIAQVGLILAVLFTGLLVVVRHEPYFYPLYNTTDRRISLALVLLVFVGMGAYTERGADNSSPNAYFTAATILVLIALFLICSVAITTEMRELFNERSHKYSGYTHRGRMLRRHIDGQLPDLRPGLANLLQNAFEAAEDAEARGDYTLKGALSSSASALHLPLARAELSPTLATDLPPELEDSSKADALSRIDSIALEDTGGMFFNPVYFVDEGDEEDDFDRQVSGVLIRRAGRGGSSTTLASTHYSANPPTPRMTPWMDAISESTSSLEGDESAPWD
ncbi:uncharacterized protein AMSG_05045 [Thecamonas trahens ATCC 50062]|uniref:Sushi domain-containing protein n=1 Tax=Thecamonas trahens ATCC 50062 TaxID=461836 RepID=A0A0L0DCQ0_THETB|nr:hypothetical protein AMSG_05045 [Thecamonas trahens ATCC 50062]KNC49083.1 hypothetical protein AMSG_05045 [Thecamonas trahens ATCC 50062]|eukprot:XP_013758114.1 hypothetical protein AMSG_05045 [Thecamonas trahens ATCC 50062]